MTLIGLDFQQIHIRIVRSVCLHLFAVHVQWRLSCLVNGGPPKGVEVCRILGIGLQQLGREANLDVVLILFVVHRSRQPQLQESGLLHRSHVNHGTSVLQPNFAFRCGRHHVRTYLVRHLHILRHAVERECHLHFGFLAGLVEPVGMVGNRQP